MAVIYVFIEGKEGCWKVHSCLEAHKLGKDDIGLVVIDTPIDNSAIYADVDDVINFVQVERWSKNWPSLVFVQRFLFCPFLFYKLKFYSTNLDLILNSSRSKDTVVSLL